MATRLAIATPMIASTFVRSVTVYSPVSRYCLVGLRAPAVPKAACIIDPEHAPVHGALPCIDVRVVWISREYYGDIVLFRVDIWYYVRTVRPVFILPVAFGAKDTARFPCENDVSYAKYRRDRWRF